VVFSLVIITFTNNDPFSGLDAYNAHNVVDSLASLAKNYKRTVVFTIHQPRSNIVSLFDQLLVLAQGRVVYSGEASQCQDYLQKIGHPCPPGFNIADYLSKYHVLSYLTFITHARCHS
jgi:ABC-type multidrug transport system ATPase subunit